MNQHDTIRVRFAPSPTGAMHIGNLRVALYNFLFARKQHGTFLLRIEDTDQTREVEGAAEALIQTLKTFGLNFDEEPHFQSTRTEIYREHADTLLKKGKAYRCFCTQGRLDALRDEQRAAKLQPKYDRFCLGLSEQERTDRFTKGKPFVIRLLIPGGETVAEDIIRGRVVFPHADIDDQVLLKSDGFPTYHLANVVDDHLMGVTHVIRGEEWLSSLPKHLLLYAAFGWTPPQFAHLPLILNKDKSKLSKRQGDVSAESYLKKGYIKEALLNYLALLGFNPRADQEIYSVTEMIELFDLTKVNKSGAIFDLEKLNWMNGHYLRTMDPAEILRRIETQLEAGAGKQLAGEQGQKIIQIERQRAATLQDIVSDISCYLEDPNYDSGLLVWKKADQADAFQNLTQVSKWIAELDQKVFERVDSLESDLKGRILASGRQTGNVLWPLRVALSGKSVSASPFELLWVLGKENSLRRMEAAIQSLS